MLTNNQSHDKNKTKFASLVHGLSWIGLATLTTPWLRTTVNNLSVKLDEDYGDMACVGTAIATVVASMLAKQQPLPSDAVAAPLHLLPLPSVTSTPSISAEKGRGGNLGRAKRAGPRPII
ncbi:hypothetical protein TIFTF001_016966 [Ficus carica]|uniref:Uncharacterized protein n=1 Tax=Ficus carica TaxID=3494 RepID=A0AA88A1A8_FICCA|nr:hypothetical protein TIFTF001_016966 [Ficus carica]